MDNAQHRASHTTQMDDLPLPMQQVVAGDGPEVQLGGCLEQQLGAGDGVVCAGAGNPDAQPIKARLQLSTQHERGGGFRPARVADEDGAAIEAAAFQPGLQVASWRDGTVNRAGFAGGVLA